MNLRRWILLGAALMLAVVGTVILLSESGSDRGDEEIVIGFSVDSLVVERWIRDRDGFIAAARELGATIIYRNALESADQQVEDLRELHRQGVDVLVVIPYDSRALSEEINRIAADGVPVISYDRLILNANIAAYVSFENVRVGELMAQGVTERLDGGNVVIVNGGSRDNNSVLLNRGFLNVLDPLQGPDGFTVVRQFYPSDWEPALFTDDLEQFLDSGVRVDAIIAANDQFADAVIEILLRRRLAGEVIVVGQDADLVAVQRLVQGIQHRTIYKPVQDLASAAAEIAFSLASGQAVRSDRSVDNGFAELPFIAIEPIPVEADTIDSTVIADGYHRSEDVYAVLDRRDG
jgi:D-xylose transport system substrate-binding protein